jgi:hypothetical protein
MNLGLENAEMAHKLLRPASHVALPDFSLSMSLHNHAPGLMRKKDYFCISGLHSHFTQVNII